MYSDRKQISSSLHHDWGCIDNKREQVKFWKLWKYDVSWLAWWLHWSIYLSKLIESYALNWCFSLLLNYISLMLIFKLTRKKQGVGLSKKKKQFILKFAAAKSLQSCPTLCNPRPWDSPGENTGEGCHFLLQCIKLKSESEVAQSCLTLHDPMDCSLPGSSIHGIFQARVLEWGAIAFSDSQV